MLWKAEKCSKSLQRVVLAWLYHWHITLYDGADEKRIFRDFPPKLAILLTKVKSEI